jgi:replicative DNA helicase
VNRLTHRAEEALLGAMMLNPGAVRSLNWIPVGAFSTPDHGALWQIMQGTDWSKIPNSQIPATITAAVEKLPDVGLRQCLSPSNLFGLVSHCPTAANASLYGGMVLEAATHRAVEHAGTALRLAATEAEVDQAGEALAHADATTGQRFEALRTAWSAAPETVRNLLDTRPAEPLAVAPRAERARTDPRAEAETVSSLLYEPRQLAEVTGWLKSADFHDPQLRAVYQAMGTLADRHAPVDPLTLAWEAQRQPGPQISAQVMEELERGGMSGIAAHTGEQVLATAALDRMHEAGHRVRNLARSPVLAPAALLTRSTQAIEPLSADLDRIHQAGREIEPAADKEPAPVGYSPELAAHAHEMEIDL